MNKIAVLIPCYNEEKTIEKVVTDFKKELPTADVYVYDNNSEDKTAEIARKAGAIVRKETKQGKGNVIRRMFREINADVYILVDGDDTYPASAAMEMTEMISCDNIDMVIGDRLSDSYFIENKRRFHNFGNIFMRWSINKIFNANIKDVMTGYRAFSYEFVKTFPVLSSGFEIETEMTIHAVNKNMNVENLPIKYKDRPDGSFSKLNTYSDGFKVILSMIKMYQNYKPLSFFGFISLILILLSAFLFIPVFFDYINTGLVLRFPTLIVSGFIAMAGLLSLFSGLILENIERKNKQNFELLYINLKKIK